MGATLADPRGLHLKVKVIVRVLALELALDLPAWPITIGQRATGFLERERVCARGISARAASADYTATGLRLEAGAQVQIP